jgi:hypothetical protein
MSYGVVQSCYHTSLQNKSSDPIESLMKSSVLVEACEQSPQPKAERARPKSNRTSNTETKQLCTTATTINPEAVSAEVKEHAAMESVVMASTAQEQGDPPSRSSAAGLSVNTG